MGDAEDVMRRLPVYIQLLDFLSVVQALFVQV